MIKNLTLTYNPNPSSLVPQDGYWLTIEQVKEDEKATIGFVAETIDALFDTSLCVEVEEEEPEETPAVEPSQFTSIEEVLAKIDQKSEVDMSACEMLRMGTYQAQLKIVRSHPEIPYALKLSVGEILETVLVEEPISRNINVVNASSVVLPFPIQSGLRCSWIGSVIGKSGFVSPPTIQAIGNTLFWSELVTGVIRAEYNTIYDLVTVEIPGVPNYVGADLGKPQDSNALAFYHYLVYRATITPVDEEEGLLEEVCGYSSSTGIDLDSDEPLPDPPPVNEEQYGCIDYFPLNHPIFEPGFYAEKCCVDGPQHDGCNVRKTKKEGGKGLSQEIINRMTNEWPGPIEFIGLGPITPEGCGANYETTQIVPKNCCEDAQPLAWDSNNSIEVLADGSFGVVFVTGGVAPYYWSIRGQGMSFAGGLRNAVTYLPWITVYASNACGWSPIEVTDGCTVVRNGIRSTNGSWSKIGEFLAVLHYLQTIDGAVDCSDNIYSGTTSIPNVMISGKYKMHPALSSDDGFCAYRADNICSQTPLVGATVVDPIVGAISWTAIVNSSWAYTGGGTGFYRNSYVVPSLGTPVFNVSEWVC